MADSVRDIQLRELKDTISELNKRIKTLQQTIETANTREAALRQERDNQKEQIDYLTKRLFGVSSEKGKCEVPGQLNLFDEPETTAAPDLAAALAEEELLSREAPEMKPRKKRAANTDRLKGLPVEQFFLDVPEEERICRECGTPLEKIGTEFVRRELDFIPAKVKVIEYYSVNYGCPKCRKEADPKGKGWACAYDSRDGECCYRCMDYVPEVLQRNASVPPGAGLETVWRKYQPNHVRELDDCKCTGFLPSNV